MKNAIIIGSVLVLLIGAFLLQDKELENESIMPKKELEKKSIEQDKKIVHENIIKTYTSIFKTKNITLPEETNNVEINSIEGQSNIEIEQEIFADLERRMTTEMESIPNCLENANTKDEAIKCSEKLDEANQELELLLGIPSNDFKKRDTQSFEWNENIKDRMIKELDSSIVPMQEMLSCLKEAETIEKRDGCFEME